MNGPAHDPIHTLPFSNTGGSSTQYAYVSLSQYRGILFNWIIADTAFFQFAGCIDNVQNAMMIGALGCCNDKMGYFRGKIDEVSTYVLCM